MHGAIKFIENKKYKEANNISSAYMIKDLLENAYVLESDLVLSNPNLIRKYEYYIVTEKTKSNLNLTPLRRL